MHENMVWHRLHILCKRSLVNVHSYIHICSYDKSGFQEEGRAEEASVLIP